MRAESINKLSRLAGEHLEIVLEAYATGFSDGFEAGFRNASDATEQVIRKYARHARKEGETCISETRAGSAPGFERVSNGQE